MKILLFSLLLLSLLCCGESGKRRKLLVVSLDGFGQNIFDAFADETRALEAYFVENSLFASNGMIPTYSSQTLPVHFSMATGLYQETHGIVGNYFYDLQKGEKFQCGVNSNDPSWFNDFAEPIWSVAEKQGVKTLVTNWFGSEVEFKANFSRPSFWRKFEKRDLQIHLNDAVDMLVKIDAVDLAMVYHHEPDNTTHKTGVGSEEFRRVLTVLNTTFTKLHERLVRENLEDSINVMIVSDHGLANVTESFYLLDMAPNITDCTRMIDDGGAILQIWTKNDTCTTEVMKEIGEALFKLGQERGKHLMQLFAKRDLDMFHYQNNPRIGDILIEGAIGVHIVKDPWVYTDWPRPKADHGWRNSDPSMRSIFIGKGPAFEAVQFGPYEVVEYFNLIANILGIEAGENNGTIKDWSPFLKTSSAFSSVKFAPAALVVVTSLLTVLLGSPQG